MQMYAVKCFVITRVTNQDMIIVSDTLSDYILLIKFFDNYEWVFSVLQGHIWKSASYCINHAHALVMSIFSSIKPCITYHSSDMPHNMNLKKRPCSNFKSPILLVPQKVHPLMAQPNLHITCIDHSSCHASSNITCIKFNSTNRECAHPLSQRPVPVLKFILKPNHFHQFLSGSIFEGQFSSAGKP